MTVTFVRQGQVTFFVSRRQGSGIWDRGKRWFVQYTQFSVKNKEVKTMCGAPMQNSPLQQFYRNCDRKVFLPVNLFFRILLVNTGKVGVENGRQWRNFYAPLKQLSFAEKWVSSIFGNGLSIMFMLMQIVRSSTVWRYFAIRALDAKLVYMDFGKIYARLDHRMRLGMWFQSVNCLFTFLVVFVRIQRCK